MSEREVRVVVEADPDVWVPGPVYESPDQWLAAAEAALAEAFEIEGDGDEAAYLHLVLSEFAAVDLAADLRYLRLRALQDVPLVVRVDFYDATSDAGTDPLALHDDGSAQTVRTPVVETIDAALGLRRIVTIQADPRRPTATVRYHRAVTELSADIVVSCAGADLRAVLEGLPDLDAFAAGVRLLGQDGEPR